MHASYWSLMGITTCNHVADQELVHASVIVKSERRHGPAKGQRYRRRVEKDIRVLSKKKGFILRKSKFRNVVMDILACESAKLHSPMSKQTKPQPVLKIDKAALEKLQIAAEAGLWEHCVEAPWFWSAEFSKTACRTTSQITWQALRAMQLCRSVRHLIEHISLKCGVLPRHGGRGHVCNLTASFRSACTRQLTRGCYILSMCFLHASMSIF